MTYSSKATALRGAARQNLGEGTFTVGKTEDGKWEIMQLAQQVAERIVAQIDSGATVDPAMIRGAQARTADRMKIERVGYDRTSPKGAVKTVHDWMRRNPEATRKEVIVALAQKGVHPSTAATQRFKWLKAQDEGEGA